jgi:outer membrane protein TolC
MRALISLCFFTGLFSYAAGALDLATAQRLAEGGSPELGELAARRDAASWKRLEEISAHLPHLSLKGDHMFGQTFEQIELDFNGSHIVMPAITPYSVLSARASIDVFDGFESWNRYQAARLEFEARQVEYERARFQLRDEVRILFYRALGAEALVDVAAQNIKTLEQHLADVRAQVRGGVSTRFDSLRIEVQLEDARNEKMSADDAAVIARAKLWKALGRPDDGGGLQGRLPEDFSDLDVDHITAEASARQDRQARILEERAAAKRAAAETGKWLPRIDVFGQQDWYNNVNGSMGSDSHFRSNYAVGVGLTWDLFDGGRSLAERAEAAAHQREASAKLKALNDSIPVEVEFWRRRFKYSLATVRAKKLSINKAEESVRLARNGVKAGVRTNTEVLDAELDLNQAKARAVTARVDAIEALSQLELAVGHAIIH